MRINASDIHFDADGRQLACRARRARRASSQASIFLAELSVQEIAMVLTDTIDAYYLAHPPPPKAITLCR